jgi:hypothetical protein
MKRFLLSFLLVLTAAAPLMAQTPDVVANVKRELQQAGVDLSGACGAIKITNAVAFRAHYALLHKAGGNRAILKADGSCLTGEQSSDSEGFATDYVIDPHTGFGFDLLGDGGGANNPQWAGPENSPDMVARNWQNLREPFDPSSYLHATAVPVPSVPPATVVLDLSSVQAQLAEIAAKVDNLTRADDDAHKSLNQNITDFHAEARPAIEAIKSFAAFAGKYVLPAVAGYFTAKHF